KSNEHFDIVEFTVGPRFNFENYSPYFAELTFGALMVTRKYKFITIEHEYTGNNYYPEFSSDPDFGFAFTGALGKEFRVENNTSLILKLRIVNAFSIQRDLFTYVSAAAGISFNTKNNEKSKNKINTLGLGAAFLAGVNSPKFISKADYDWGSDFGLEMFYKISSKIEILIDANSNQIYPIIYNAHNLEASSFSFTGGSRFLMNQNSTTAFIEIGGGIYSHKIYASSLGVSAEVYNESTLSPGIYFATGPLIKINRYCDMILKGNLNFLFSGKYDYAPNYLTLQGGLRFNL
ncbi:MAG TPA: hypothetical protein VGK25_05560, partial [Ignavibacteria bacterium]